MLLSSTQTLLPAHQQRPSAPYHSEPPTARRARLRLARTPRHTRRPAGRTGATSAYTGATGCRSPRCYGRPSRHRRRTRTCRDQVRRHHAHDRPHGTKPRSHRAEPFCSGFLPPIIPQPAAKLGLGAPIGGVPRDNRDSSSHPVGATPEFCPWTLPRCVTDGRKQRPRVKIWVRFPGAKKTRCGTTGGFS